MTDLLDAIARLDSGVLYAVVFALALCETAILADLVVPGEVGLLVASAAGAHADLPLALLWVAAVAGATAGDTVSYAIGRRWGTSIIRRPGRSGRPLGGAFQAAVASFERHGGAAVFFGRWVGALRAIVPLVAGSTRMKFDRFLAWNVLASLGWAGVVVTLGYHVGPRAARWIDQGGLALLALVLLVAAAVALRHWIRARTVTPGARR